MIKPRTVIDVATDEDIARFSGGLSGPAFILKRWTGRVIRKGSLVAALGGLIEAEEGVWVAFFQVPAYLRKPSIYRHILAGVAEVKAMGAREIRAFCDDEIEGAERLMRHMGFEPTDEIIENRTLWKWLI